MPGQELAPKPIEAKIGTLKRAFLGRLAALRQVLAGLRAKLIVPYVVLTLLTAIFGLYVITRLVTSSVRERFVNQLFESSRVAADGTVRREQANLSSLRLMAFTQGVSQAVEEGDGETLTSLLWPLALNEGVDVVIVLDETGGEILGLVQEPGSIGFERTEGSDLSEVDLIARVLKDEADAQGDKFVGVLATDTETFFATSAPVRDRSGDLAGAIVVAVRMQSLVEDLKSQALADIVLFDRSSAMLATTLTEPAEGYSVLGFPAEQLGAEFTPFIREISLYGRDFQVIYSPWIVRQEMHGVLGVVLPSNFIVTSEATSRNSLSFIFSVSTVGVILLGYMLAQSIARPILRLRSIAQAVAAGDLDQDSGLERSDEIGDLAQAFDIMTGRLQARTAEAERLYAEAIENNLQLAEMYEKLQATQHQLIQSEKLAAVGQLAAGIVHDVKNPLGVIKGMAEELTEGIESDQAIREGLGVIFDNASRANRIVTELLTFARQSPLSIDLRDLRQTVEGSLRLTDYLLRKGKVTSILDLPSDEVLVAYDAQQIEQVLVNLIQNAVQAMPEGGELSIRLDTEEAMAVVALEDTGEGIAPDALPRIFDPFFTTKPEGQGTGMGLSVSYGIVSNHGGRIEVESEVGRGTVFIVRLPLEQSEDEFDGEAAA